MSQANICTFRAVRGNACLQAVNFFPEPAEVKILVLANNILPAAAKPKGLNLTL